MKGAIQPVVLSQKAAVDKFLQRVFVPDTILPEQLFGRNAYPRLNGSIGLALAILEDGVVQFMKHAPQRGRRQQRLFEYERDWIFSNASNYLYDFVPLCEVLHINPSYLRDGISAWYERYTQDPNRDSHQTPKIRRSCYAPATGHMRRSKTRAA